MEAAPEVATLQGFKNAAVHGLEDISGVTYGRNTSVMCDSSMALSPYQLGLIVWQRMAAGVVEPEHTPPPEHLNLLAEFDPLTGNLHSKLQVRKVLLYLLGSCIERRWRGRLTEWSCLTT